MEARKNDIVQLTVEGYGAKGEGTARLDGMAVFVKGALRGERCRVRLLKVGKHAAWGRVEEVLTPSPARLAPDCPHCPICGGCQLRHMCYEEELWLKRRRVEDAFLHIGGLSLSLSAVHGADGLLRYRSKAQYQFAQSGSAVDAGFYRARSHQVIDIPSCLLQSRQADLARAAVKGWMEDCGIPAYREDTHSGLVRHLFVRTNRRGESLVCVAANAPKLPRAKELTAALTAACPGLLGVVFNCNEQAGNTVFGSRFSTLWGQSWLEETLCGLRFRLSVPSFFQVNTAQAELLCSRAASLAGLTGGETLLDLYCGTGTIGLTMAARAGRVIGCDVVPQAISDARENARRNGIDNAEFHCGDAGSAARQLEQSGIRPDVVLVDPPRKGLDGPVIEAILQMSPPRLVYISCDPASLARDLAILSARGYRPQRAEAVDLFPRTCHVETVVLLERARG